MNQNYENQPTEFKEAVREKIEKPKLENGQLEKLLAMQENIIDESLMSVGVVNYFSQWLRGPTVWAASIILVSFIILSIWNINSPVDYTRQIAQEVVKNHLKLKPLDVNTQSIEGIRSYFTQLDFSPIRSSVLQQNFATLDSNLLGGRYCSIKGITAAQLRYKNRLSLKASGSISTLYQVAYEPSLHGKIPHVADNESPVILSIKGLAVTFWVEKDLLMVLVTDS